jgi:murein DD-endopeptidase MepM/ murein hydrolase activator NlpD
MMPGIFVAVMMLLSAPSFGDPMAAPVISTAPASPAMADPFLWPVSKMIGPRKVQIVSKFGRRKVPAIPAIATMTVVVPSEEVHKGIDFAVPPDSNVRASRPGRVLFAGFSADYASRANKKEKHHLLIVRHADGMTTRYVHLNRLMVRPGQEVKAGDILGTSSDSDEWNVPVLHFEIRDPNGTPLDPLDYLDKLPAVAPLPISPS